jgi:hypothetical protein
LDRFMCSRPAFTSATISHSIGAMLLYHGQTVCSVWQSRQARCRIPAICAGIRVRASIVSVSSIRVSWRSSRQTALLRTLPETTPRTANPRSVFRRIPTMVPFSHELPPMSLGKHTSLAGRVPLNVRGPEWKRRVTRDQLPDRLIHLEKASEGLDRCRAQQPSPPAQRFGEII